MNGFRPWSEYHAYDEAEMRERSQDFADDIVRRRSIREFSPCVVPKEIIETCLRAAASAPSGANRQPWHFCVVSDPNLKQQIRVAAEAEERQFYDQRAPEAWLQDLAPLGTDADKPFLEQAPYLIVIFAQRFEVLADGTQHKNYYVSESVGIATGILISALHRAGLATLTHTPSPMKFLSRLLGRPRSERPFLILVAGYPAEGVQVPDIVRKGLPEVVSWNEAEH